jgi:hypothetical protein
MLIGYANKPSPDKEKGARLSAFFVQAVSAARKRRTIT